MSSGFASQLAVILSLSLFIISHTETMDTRPLYGGAISCPVGNSFLDVRYETHGVSVADGTYFPFSNVRQVPDNQEVFVDMETQQSLIIELLEPVEAVNEDIAR